MNSSDVAHLFEDSAVRTQEREVDKLLTELRDELDIATANSKPFKSVSSFSIPKSMDYYKSELKNAIVRSLKMSEVTETVDISQTFQEEHNASVQSDYTMENLPLALLQFYLQQIHELVSCKRSYLLRWKQFARHTKTIESSFPRFQERVVDVMHQWRNNMQRCERLSTLREMFITSQHSGPQPPQATFASLSLVQIEDVFIYLRWLTSNLAQLRFSQKFFTACQWIPHLYVNDVFRAAQKEHVVEGQARNTEILRTRKSSAASKPAFLTEVPSANNSRPSTEASRQAVSGGNLGAATWGPLSRIVHSYLPTVAEGIDSSKHLLKYLLDFYAIPLDKDVDQITTTAEYAELFVIVNNFFPNIFSQQEDNKNFKVFDSVEENWDVDSPKRTFLLKANWLEFVHFKPVVDPGYENLMTYLRSETAIDELLGLQSGFLRMNNADLVCETYKAYLLQINNTDYVPKAARVLSNRTDANTIILWKRIYNSGANNQSSDKPVEIWDLDENRLENFGSRQFVKEKVSGFDPAALLKLENRSEFESGDPGTLCVMFLRHLRLRDHQRNVLAVLNYFRSVERTIAIDSCGLHSEEQPPIVSGDEVTQPPPLLKPTSFSPRQSALSFGLEASSVGLGQPHYVYNTPKDFAISEADFMEIDDIANHANFYVIKDGRIHVKDEKGYFIMYDVAIEDFKNLEEDILLVASRVLTKSYNSSTPVANATDEILKFSNAPIDRLGVLYDIWTLEAEFEDLKRELFDLYYEAYLNAFGREVRLRLIQILVNIQHQRPRFASSDGSSAAAYIQIYRLENEILRKTITLVRDMFKAQIVHSRHCISKLQPTHIAPTDRVGLPYPIALKQPITVHIPKTAVTSVDLLEFHQTVAEVAQHLPGIIGYITDELIRVAKTGGDVLKQLRVGLFSIECMTKEWNDHSSLGSTFSQKVQNDVLFDALADDPMYMTQLIKGKLSSLESEMVGLTRNEQATRIFTALCRVLDIVSFRHRLTLALYESEVLGRVYKQFGKSLNFEPYHLYLRCLHMENAIKREHMGFMVHVPQPGAPEEDFVSSGLDKFVATSMPLAVQEVDENHIPKFSMRQPASVKSMLNDIDFRRLQITLTCQLAHKNLLTASCQLMYYVQDHLPVPRGIKELVDDVPKQSKTNTDMPFEGLTRKESVPVPPQVTIYKPPETLPECFISIQLEKLTKRYFVHNWFVDTKIQMGFALKNPVEFEKVVGNAVIEFSQMITTRASIIAIKAHLIAYYTDILMVLQDFPSIRDNFFQMGYAKEVKNKNELTRDYLNEEPLTFRSRPRTVFSADGNTFMNLWFIPFPSEILQSFFTRPDHDSLAIFQQWLRIVAALHDILVFMAAFAKLGIRINHGKGEKSVLPAAAVSAASAEWGGAEGIGAELFDIQMQISALASPSDAELVAQFLELRRRAAFLSLDVTVRHLMRDALLPHSADSYYGLVAGLHHSLPLLTGSAQRNTISAYQSGIAVPEPLEARDKVAKAMFPHRVHINRNGPFSTATTRFHNIIHLVHTCFCRLTRTDRQVLNGELMNLTLMTEEILRHARNGYAHLFLIRDGETDPFEYQSSVTSANQAHQSRPSSASSSRLASTTFIGTTVHLVPNVRQLEQSFEAVPTKLNQPILAYSLVCVYLRLWKQLEVFKDHFMKTKLGFSDCRTGWTADLYEEGLNIYCTERYGPMLQTIYNLFGNSELSLMLNFAKSSREIMALPIPSALSDLDCKAIMLAQLVQITLCNAFNLIVKRLQRDNNLVLNEKAREEEDALPTDLWKKPGIKENFTIAQPQLVEQFTGELYGGIKERRDGEVVISLDSLNSALNALAAGSMARERYCFENYSSYYEALLRQFHRELYSKERHIESLQAELESCRENVNTAALEKMATSCRDLLLEVTSLRLRMSDSEAKQRKRDEAIRLSVKSEFSGLVDALAAASLQLRSRFDAYRHRIAGETDELIKLEKEQVMAKIREISGKAFAQPVAHDPMDASAELEAEVHNLREEKRQLELLVSRMRAIDKWRITTLTAKFSRKVEELESEINHIKCENCDYRLLSDEEVLLLRQQQVTLKKAVSLAERETMRVHLQLEKDARIRQEREQALREQMAAQEKSHQARTSTFEQVVTDLAERNVVVRQLAVELDSRERVTEVDRHNATRDLRSARSQLVRERDLKQQAIGRLGELARVVGDMEYIVTTQQAFSPMKSAPATAPPSRPSTATVRQLSSHMAAQFAASKPPSNNDDQLDMTPEVSFPPFPKPALRPTTASASINRAKRPQTGSSSPGTFSLGTLPKTSSPVSPTGVVPSIKTRAKSAKTSDLVRFNILSDLDPPTFDQIRLLSRSSTTVSKAEPRQNAFS